MVEPKFKVAVGASGWESPLSEQPSFEKLENAQYFAREYIAEQSAPEVRPRWARSWSRKQELTGRLYLS